LHFASGAVFFECTAIITSDYDTRQVKQEHEPRTLIRMDGKCHEKTDANLAEAQLPKTTHVREANQGHHVVTRLAKYREEDQPNWQYVKQQEIIRVMTDQSARHGMRGNFDFLWRFSGLQLREKFEFHKIWYETVEMYTRRSLSRHTDKLIAMSGIATFIQKNTKFTYNSGLWQEIMPLNLLWVLSSAPVQRPMRPIPTWSWASVDGIVTNNLKEAMPLRSNQFRSKWCEVDVHISRKVQLHSPVKVDELVMSSRLELRGRLIPFTPGIINVAWDVANIDFGSNLFFLPIMSFKNTQVKPVHHDRHLHGIIVYKSAKESYERAGYFWSVGIGVDELSELNDNPPRRQTIILT
jgi:hypothetical protein